jgi:hypothetical protein
MSDLPTKEDSLLRLSLRTVEYFGAVLVVAYWLFLVTGSTWGDKFHYSYLFDVSIPVMVIVAVAGGGAWRRYRKHALIDLAVVVAWALWAALPRL